MNDISLIINGIRYNAVDSRNNDCDECALRHTCRRVDSEQDGAFTGFCASMLDECRHFEIFKDNTNTFRDNSTMTQTEHFRNIAGELTALYERKNLAYGNSFGETFQKLGIISAVTRISDKYNRLCNLATHPDIDNLGESIDDTLRDLASYAIMTIIELNKSNQEK